MKSVLLAGLLVVPFAGGVASAGEDVKEQLIQLDKQWGEADVKGDADAVAALVADELISVAPEGVGGKAELLNTIKSRTSQPGGSYTAGDYKVMLIDENTAVMTHSTTGPEAHRSFHVWARRDGKWRVVATMATPIKE